MDRAKCRSCQADIIWIRSSNNNLMPLDAQPNPEGNIVIKDGVAHVMKGDLFEEMLEGERYMTHFATCPNSAKHRKKK